MPARNRVERNGTSSCSFREKSLLKMLLVSLGTTIATFSPLSGRAGIEVGAGGGTQWVIERHWRSNVGSAQHFLALRNDAQRGWS